MTGDLKRPLVSNPQQLLPSHDSIVCASSLTVCTADRLLLDGLTLEVLAGSSVAIMGPSGTGKTTLLACLAGLRRPDSGRIRVAGHDVSSMPRRDLPRWRLGHVGVVYQFGELLPELTAAENVRLPALLAGANAETADRAAKNALGAVGGNGLADRRAAVLSGGERQRIATARALVNIPEVIFADEPTGALDRRSAAEVAAVLFDLPRARGCALVVVTHDEEIARQADRVLSLDDGRLISTPL